MLAVITARGGSKRLPGKNKKDFKGKPLIAWTIEAALSSRYLSRVVVSTDCAEIAKLSLDYGAEVPFLRDSALAQDKTSSSDVLIDVLSKVQKTDYTVLLQPTSPLRHYKHIDKAYELHKSKGPLAFMKFIGFINVFVVSKWRGWLEKHCVICFLNFAQNIDQNI